MPGLEGILNISASALSAQATRLSTIASNLANAHSVSGSEESTYRAKFPVFKEIKDEMNYANNDGSLSGGVKVTDVISSSKPLQKIYDPTNPLANESGYIYQTDVNPIQQMTDMMAASKEYQAGIEMMNTTKQLISKSLSVINSK